jgi:hypothetical protein
MHSRWPVILCVPNDSLSLLCRGGSHLSMPSQRILSAPVLNRQVKTSAQPIQARKDGVMQNGSLSRERRKRSSGVWCYRWWESGPTGRRIHRRIILGTVEQLHDKRAANQAMVGLRSEINSHDIPMKTTLMTVAELADHFRQRELLDNNMRITYSTKKAYVGYLTKWIVPRWGQNALQYIKAREVELWLASVQRARTTRENPQCDECAIQPCTPVRSLRWQPYTMGAPKRQTP